MEEAAFERADQASTQYVKGGRTLEDIGTEFAYLRRERGLSQPDPESAAGHSGGAAGAGRWGLMTVQ